VRFKTAFESRSIVSQSQELGREFQTENSVKQNALFLNLADYPWYSTDIGVGSYDEMDPI